MSGTSAAGFPTLLSVPSGSRAGHRFRWKLEAVAQSNRVLTFLWFTTRSSFVTESSRSGTSRSGRLGRSHEVGENGGCRIPTRALLCATAADDKGQPGHSVVRLVRRPPECGYCRSHQLAEDRLRTSRVIIPRIGGWCLASAPRRCCWRSEPGVSSRSGSSSASAGLIARRLQAR